MAEAKTIVKEVKASDKVKAKNIAGRDLYVSTGIIKDGKVGEVTMAELQVLIGKLEKA